MTPNKDYQIPMVVENVTRGIEHYKFLNDKQTAEVLVRLGFGYLAPAFDSNYGK
jgi:hypothetical protein